MRTAAIILDGPITEETESAAVTGFDTPRNTEAQDLVGASVRFEGLVRRLEDGRALLALDYQTYDPMAQRQFELLATDVGTSHGLASIVALHSRGRVGVGEVSFVLEVSAMRRAEALAAVSEFIDRMKRDVPIWKRPVWA